MTNQDIKRIEEDMNRIEKSAYEQGFQDGFKKQDNEMYNKGWNEAMEAISDSLRRKGLSERDYNGTIVFNEIQKLKK